MTRERDEYFSEARRTLERIDCKILSLKTHAKMKSDSELGDTHGEIAKLLSMKIDATNAVNDLRLASKPAWQNEKKSTDRLLKSLEETVDNAINRIAVDG